MTVEAADITIPDIERIAATILAQAHPQHPVLREWVQKLTSDPDYDESFLRFEPGEDAVRWAEQCGFAAEKRGSDLFPNEAVVRAILNSRAVTGDTEGVAKFQAYKDAAILRLAMELQSFRAENRPSGEVTRPIQGLGGPIALVHTSLAAAVAEYAANITDAAFDAMQWD